MLDLITTCPTPKVAGPKEVFMRSTKKIAIIFSAIFFLLGLAVFSTPAQRVVRVYRPVIVRPYYWGWRDPFWGMNSWWNDPYMNDPYLWEQRERYYRERDVKDAQRKIEKDRAKYMKDGYID